MNDDTWKDEKYFCACEPIRPKYLPQSPPDLCFNETAAHVDGNEVDQVNSSLLFELFLLCSSYRLLAPSEALYVTNHVLFSSADFHQPNRLWRVPATLPYLEFIFTIRTLTGGKGIQIDRNAEHEPTHLQCSKEEEKNSHFLFMVLISKLLAQVLRG